MGRFFVYLLNLIFVVFLGWVLNRLLRAAFGQQNAAKVRASRRSAGRAIRGETARDPVCGMFVSTEVSHRLSRHGETLHFCSRECLKRYEADARKA
jgi:YHS domain-containing protein